MSRLIVLLATPAAALTGVAVGGLVDLVGFGPPLLGRAADRDAAPPAGGTAPPPSAPKGGRQSLARCQCIRTMPMRIRTMPMHSHDANAFARCQCTHPCLGVHR